jgi:hypothetical protein
MIEKKRNGYTHQQKKYIKRPKCSHYMNIFMPEENTSYRMQRLYRLTKTLSARKEHHAKALWTDDPKLEKMIVSIRRKLKMDTIARTTNYY